MLTVCKDHIIDDGGNEVDPSTLGFALSLPVSFSPGTSCRDLFMILKCSPVQHALSILWYMDYEAFLDKHLDTMVLAGRDRVLSVEDEESDIKIDDRPILVDLEGELFEADLLPMIQLLTSYLGGFDEIKSGCDDPSLSG